MFTIYGQVGCKKQKVYVLACVNLNCQFVAYSQFLFASLFSINRIDFEVINVLVF